jgi:hypothetical protein
VRPIEFLGTHIRVRNLGTESLQIELSLGHQTEPGGEEAIGATCHSSPDGRDAFYQKEIASAGALCDVFVVPPFSDMDHREENEAKSVVAVLKLVYGGYQLEAIRFNKLQRVPPLAPPNGSALSCVAQAADGC